MFGQFHKRVATTVRDPLKAVLSPSNRQVMDLVLRDEIRDLNPAISFAEVKTAIGSRAAQSVSADQARTLIRESLKAAVINRNKPDPWQVARPVTLQATLCSPLITDVAEAIPGFKRISANDVIFMADDMPAIMRAIFIILSSAGILFTDPYR